ncbi:MAG: hypothetical protein O7D36_07525, partial [Gammaproteobacteria bacterium]|nr:hypothetical protein [Gammaproteobacteria bacterium]
MSDKIANFDLLTDAINQGTKIVLPLGIPYSLSNTAAKIFDPSYEYSLLSPATDKGSWEFMKGKIMADNWLKITAVTYLGLTVYLRWCLSNSIDAYKLIEIELEEIAAIFGQGHLPGSALIGQEYYITNCGYHILREEYKYLITGNSDFAQALIDSGEQRIKFSIEEYRIKLQADKLKILPQRFGPLEHEGIVEAVQVLIWYRNTLTLLKNVHEKNLDDYNKLVSDLGEIKITDKSGVEKKAEVLLGDTFKGLKNSNTLSVLLKGLDDLGDFISIDDLNSTVDRFWNGKSQIIWTGQQ